MGPLSKSARAWLAGVLLAAVLGALAWPLVGDRVADRHLDLSLVVQGKGPLELCWVHAGTHNGCWIDTEDPLLRSSPAPGGGRAFNITQWLPTYAIDALEVNAPSGTRVEVARATIHRRVLGIRLAPRDLRSSAGTGSLLAHPPVWREAVWPGALLTGAIAAGVVLLAWLLWYETRRLEAWRARVGFGDASEPRAVTAGDRRWTVAAIVVSLAAPILMALWSPVFILADSTAYLWFVDAFLKDPTLQHFDGWRLPGYALFLAPFVSLTRDFAFWAALAHIPLAAATALLVLDMLRARLRAPWPQLAAILIAVDPHLLAWQRVLMTETLSAFLVTLAGWLFLRLVAPRGPAPDEPAAAPAWRHAGVTLALGLTCGCACWVRGNNQIIPVVLAAGMAWQALATRRPRLVAAAVGVVLGAALLVWPLARINQRHHGHAALTVAPSFPKAVFAWDMAVVDWNQSGTLSFEEFTKLRQKLRTAGMPSWDVMAWIGHTRAVPVPEGTSDWNRKDIRTGALFREARARQTPLFTLRQLQSAVLLLGVPLPEPRYALSSTMGVFRQLRGKPNENTTTNLDFPLDRLPPLVRSIVERSVHDVSWMEGHPAARAFGLYFKGWLWVRAALALAFIAAVLRLLVTRRHAMTTLGLVVLANAVAIPLLTYGCEYRFSAPFVPLMVVVAVYGLLAPARVRPAA